MDSRPPASTALNATGYSKVEGEAKGNVSRAEPARNDDGHSTTAVADSTADPFCQPVLPSTAGHPTGNFSPDNTFR